MVAAAATLIAPAAMLAKAITDTIRAAFRSGSTVVPLTRTLAGWCWFSVILFPLRLCRHRSNSFLGQIRADVFHFRPYPDRSDCHVHLLVWLGWFQW